MTGEEFKELLISYFPKVKDLQTTKGVEPLTTPEVLSTYNVPLQWYLDLLNVYESPHNV